MKIISLKANNVLRVKAIEINANGKSVTLSGKNGSGKTSTMRCIEMALRGAGAIAEKPIHGDEEDARIILDLGDFKVLRTFHKTNDQTTLTITTKEGAKYPKPQAILDGLCSQLSFDPLDFARMGVKDPEKQVKTLKSLVGLDFSDLDLRRKTLFDERTMNNRDLKAAETKIAGKSEFPGLPEKPVSMTELVDELNRANAHNQECDTFAESLRNDDSALTVKRSDLTNKKAELVEAEAKVEKLKGEVSVIVEAGKKAVKDLEARREQFKGMNKIPTAPTQEKITNCENTNTDIRFNQQLKNDTANVETYRKKSEDLTSEIDAIDADKQKQLTSAKFPLKGLGFTDTGVTLDGIPFAQCSTGDQIRASAAIGMALNPKLRVLLIRDASLLDKDGLDILAKMAKDNDVQLWLEEVGDSEEVSVTIEGEGQK